MANELTIRTLKLWEGLPGTNGMPALKAYRDIAGIWTNGWGNTRNVTPHSEITWAQAEADIAGHIAEAEDAIRKHVKVKLNANQVGALIMFYINVGPGRPAGAKSGKVGFLDSNLLRILNTGDYSGAAQQYDRWIYFTDPKTNKPAISKGLQNRRAAEKLLFNTPVEPPQFEHPVSTATVLAKVELSQPQPVAPPQPQSVMETSTGKAVVGAISSGVAGLAASAKPIADAATTIGGINATNLLAVLGVMCAFGTLAALVWLLYDRARKVREDGR